MYMHHDEGMLTRNLAAFEKITLQPGEKATVPRRAPVVRVGVHGGKLFQLSSAKLIIGDAGECAVGDTAIGCSYGYAIGGGLLALTVGGLLVLCCRRRGPREMPPEFKEGLIDEAGVADSADQPCSGETTTRRRARADRV